MSQIVKQIEKDSVRASHRSWRAEDDSEPLFTNVVTLDPTLAEQSWIRLSTYTPMLEFHGIQKRLHGSLMNALMILGPKKS